MALEKQRFEIGACGVEGSRVPRAPGTHDDYVADVIHRFYELRFSNHELVAGSRSLSASVFAEDREISYLSPDDVFLAADRLPVSFGFPLAPAPTLANSSGPILRAPSKPR